MTVEELEANYGPARGGFDRTPPQNIEAEQSVLGAMMLSKDAMADVIEVVRGSDFYKPTHETIFEAAVRLYNSGDPVDAVTVAAELQGAGNIGRIGGAEYIHELISSVPSAASAGYYARLVHEQAILRRLVAAGTRISNMAYGADGDEVDVIVDSAQSEVFAVTESRNSEDYLPIGDVMERTLSEVEAASAHDGSMLGIPTGFRELDELIGGFQAGQMIVIAARPAIGKSTLGLDICRAASINAGKTSDSSSNPFW